MADLIVVIGPPAVGKMTVGQALSDATGYPLFYNHLSIEVALRFFDFGTDGFRRISSGIRRSVLEAVRKSDLTGLIYTWVWAFDEPGDLAVMQRLTNWWQEKGDGRIFFLELEATDAARRERNVDPDRLAAKPSKRDTEQSEAQRRLAGETHQFNSAGNFPLALPHLLVDNTDLAPADVAELALGHFELI